MNVEKKQVFVTKIEEDLSNGMSWLKRDDAGYGSIQEKYNATDVHIATIRKHPLLKNLEPSLVIFEVIDDTNKNNEPNITLSATKQKDGKTVGSIPESNKSTTESISRVSGLSEETVGGGIQQPAELIETDSSDAFFNI